MRLSAKRPGKGPVQAADIQKICWPSAGPMLLVESDWPHAGPVVLTADTQSLMVQYWSNADCRHTQLGGPMLVQYRLLAHNACWSYAGPVIIADTQCMLVLCWSSAD